MSHLVCDTISSFYAELLTGMIHNIHDFPERIQHVGNYYYTIQGIDFPVVSGQIITYVYNGLPGANDNVSSSTWGELSISPFSSNPFWFNQDFDMYSGIGWSDSDFCDYQDFSAVDKLAITSTNTTSNALFYDYSINNLGPF